MLDAPEARLPRGRHRLQRSEVEAAQRARIFKAMAEAMHDRGYVGTPVAEVLQRAGVSRETFYRLFSSKLDCFLAACDAVGDLLLTQIARDLDTPGTAFDRFDRVIDSYLDGMASSPAAARLFLVEVHAAGPEGVARRAALQERVAEGFAELFAARTDVDRFACRALVAAIGTLVTVPLVTGDDEALRRLAPQLRDHARRLFSGRVHAARVG